MHPDRRLSSVADRTSMASSPAPRADAARDLLDYGVLEASLDGILVLDENRRKVVQNQRCIDIWKIPPEIVAQGDDVQVRYVMSRTKNPAQFIERVDYLYAHPGETSRDEIELVDGTVLDRYSAPVRDREGCIFGRIWTFRDITEKRAAESALRDSEERFKLVARATSDAIWDWDVTSGAVWRSENYGTTFGLPSTDASAPRNAWSSRIHPEDRPRVIRELRGALEGNRDSWSDEYRFLKRDGTYAHVQDHGQIMRAPDGRACRMVGGMTDLTKQKELEAQYLRAQRIESIGTLAGGIAHDLNNLLTPILMSVGLLRLEGPGGGEQRKLIDTIEANTKRGADLVRQVLTFARGHDGQRVAVDMKCLVRELEGIIRETFPRDIRIGTAIPDGLWPVIGDRTQLHQVLLNLAVNARDAMPSGGELMFSAENIALGERDLAAHEGTRAGSYVSIRVVDTGTGISPEIRDRIFEPFFTTKAVGKGSGLGLAAVHGIVRSHGGIVVVSSQVGAGTTFEIRLPADPAAGPVKPGSESSRRPRGNGELVLVVDDEPSIVKVTELTLKAHGYKVLTAADGSEAVALYFRHAGAVSLVITDMMMPVMDGAATIDAIRRINPRARIIAASGLAVSESVAKASDAGANDFLVKPYSSSTLLPLVRDVIDRPLPGGL